MTYQQLVDALFDGMPFIAKRPHGKGTIVTDGKCMVITPEHVFVATTDICHDPDAYTWFNPDAQTPHALPTTAELQSVICGRCSGTGNVPALVECPDCKGEGTKECGECGQYYDCPRCKGGGVVPHATETIQCTACAGTGKTVPPSVQLNHDQIATRYMLPLAQMPDAYYGYDSDRGIFHITTNGGACHAWLPALRGDHDQ